VVDAILHEHEKKCDGVPAITCFLPFTVAVEEDFPAVAAKGHLQKFFTVALP
jgi:hypothetical protein